MLDRLNADLEKEQADIVSLLKTGALPEDAVNFNSGTENIESTRVDVGIDPYEACTHGVRSFELLHISREKSRKTEAVFLVGSRRPGGKSKSLRARFLLPAFSFGEGFWRSKRKC